MISTPIIPILSKPSGIQHNHADVFSLQSPVSFFWVGLLWWLGFSTSSFNKFTFLRWSDDRPARGKSCYLARCGFRLCCVLTCVRLTPRPEALVDRVLNFRPADPSVLYESSICRVLLCFAPTSRPDVAFYVVSLDLTSVLSTIGRMCSLTFVCSDWCPADPLAG